MKSSKEEKKSNARYNSVRWNEKNYVKSQKDKRRNNKRETWIDEISTMIWKESFACEPISRNFLRGKMQKNDADQLVAEWERKIFKLMVRSELNRLFFREIASVVELRKFTFTHFWQKFRENSVFTKEHYIKNIYYLSYLHFVWVLWLLCR